MFYCQSWTPLPALYPINEMGKFRIYMCVESRVIYLMLATQKYFGVIYTIISQDSYDEYTRKIVRVSILWFERSMLLTYFNPQHTRDLNFTSICACAESCVALTACTAYNFYKSNSLQIFFNIIGIEICQKSNVG